MNSSSIYALPGRSSVVRIAEPVKTAARTQAYNARYTSEDDDDSEEESEDGDSYGGYGKDKMSKELKQFFNAFADKCLDIKPYAWVDFTVAFDAYKSFCSRNGMSGKDVATSSQFQDLMSTAEWQLKTRDTGYITAITAETPLAHAKLRFFKLDKYIEYILEVRKAEPILNEFYQNTMTRHYDITANGAELFIPPHYKLNYLAYKTLQKKADAKTMLRRRLPSSVKILFKKGWLEALEWDAKHMRNKEGVYCYCGLDYTDGDSMVKCQDCKQLFHWDCVPSIKLKPLKGDSFYKFQCSVCNSGNEIYERETISWVQAIHLVLYHLIKTEPEKKYFRWRENICATISENWESLMPGKAKTATWHNTVAGSLSTHHSRFKSGFDDTQQSGNWTLQEVTPPDSTPPKATGKAKESRAPRQRSDVKKPRKKTDLSAGSEAEKEILEVLNESRGSKRSTRHRVSFSDDESDSDVGKRKARRRRVDPKILDNDIDLLQSFELFTKLEKERLGGSSQVDKPEGF
ncbi:hypothetical protein GGF37_004817, partial [Kickxella alabastrina]